MKPAFADRIVLGRGLNRRPLWLAGVAVPAGQFPLWILRHRCCSSVAIESGPLEPRLYCPRLRHARGSIAPCGSHSPPPIDRIAHSCSRSTPRR